MSKAIFYDISPMIEFNFTGISNVTAALAKYLLKVEVVDVYFMMGHLVVSHKSVETTINLRSGAVLRAQIETGSAICGYTKELAGKYQSTAAIFPSVKTISGIFTDEIQIIHDITFILTPEFHTIDTINHHGGALLQDLATNSYTFVDSECTGSDLRAYFRVDPSRMQVSYPGVDNIDSIALDEKPVQQDMSSYIVIPGTIEPRKNISLVLKFISENPVFLDKYYLVFFGKKGWLVNFENMVANYGLQKYIESKKIIFLDFISNSARDMIYKQAEFTIFPSMYEGFGLPVGEAMAQGCPVCASFSSSIPEVGGDAAVYFDPNSTSSLGDAISRLETLIQLDKPALRQKCVDQASQFTWEKFSNKIINKATEMLGV